MSEKDDLRLTTQVDVRRADSSPQTSLDSIPLPYRQAISKAFYGASVRTNRGAAVFPKLATAVTTLRQELRDNAVPTPTAKPPVAVHPLHQSDTRSSPMVIDLVAYQQITLANPAVPTITAPTSWVQPPEDAVDTGSDNYLELQMTVLSGSLAAGDLDVGLEHSPDRVHWAPLLSNLFTPSATATTFIGSASGFGRFVRLRADPAAIGPFEGTLSISATLSLKPNQ